MTYERIPMDRHVKTLKWAQGEHVLIAAPTGCGKTTLARRIIDRRKTVVTFAIKPHDDTMHREFADWEIVRDWRGIESWMNRVIIWPKWEKGGADPNIRKHKEVFGDAFDKLLSTRGWTVLVDELKYMSDPKFGGVGTQIELLHYIGRSSGTTMVSLAQRPAHVPLAVLSSASHAYIARTRLASDAKRLSDLGDVDPKALTAALAQLPSKHDFIYTPAQAEGVAGILNTRQ